jgi:FkbM family methyltransferase
MAQGTQRQSAGAGESLLFGALNTWLAALIHKTRLAKRVFDIFGRILPVPTAVVRGVPIKAIMPLNQVGVFNTFKDWETRDPEILDWIDNFEKECVFFDVGASFGTETLYAALKPAGPKKIIAFDLSLQSSFNLSYNLTLNNVDNVDQYYVALSDGIAAYTFHEPTQYYFVKDRPKYDFIPFNVISISMDQFIALTHIVPDYIKIDVDGAEQQLIAGMHETVQNSRLRSVAVEVSPESEAAVTEFFLQAGFIIAFARSLEGEDGFKNLIFTRP